MPTEYRKDRKKWGYRFFLHGKSWKQYAWDSQDEAKNAEAERRAYLLKNPPLKTDALGNVGALYLIDSAERGRSKWRIDGLRWNLNAHILPFFKAETPISAITDADVENFFKEPGQEDKLKQFIADAQARNPMMKGQQIPADQMQEIRQQFGQVLIAERKGVAAGVDKQRKTQLQIMLQQARLLASMYEEESLAKSVKASQAEIDEYMKAHPEEQVHARHILISVKSADAPTEEGLDKTAARAKAEEVLKRVKAGENFEALAKEYSTDPGSKDNGGDLGWFGRGRMVPDFEKAAFALQPGQVSEIVESPFGFHIIKVEGRRNGDPQAAAQEVEQEKEKKLIDEIVKRQSGHITIAENFAVQPPPQQQMQPGGLPFATQPPPATSSPSPKGKSSPAKKH